MSSSDLMMTTTQGAKIISKFGAPRVQLALVIVMRIVEPVAIAIVISRMRYPQPHGPNPM
jgi:hypothetical protein